MKWNRRQFLQIVSVGALSLTGCGAQSTADTAVSLEWESSLSLSYAKQFTVDYYQGGYVLLRVPLDSASLLLVPEGASVPVDVPDGTVVLHRPVKNLYLVSSAVMDLFIALDALDAVALSGTEAEDWYLEEAQQAMQEGKILYAGKYSAPDYERILAAECPLAIENTMIYHTPEVKEQLETLGVSVLVERSGYESDPLARMEWLKFYGALLDKTELAEQIYAQKLEQIAPALETAPTGKTVAFFSVTSNDLITVRKGGDYIAQMIEMAGGTYVFADLTEEDDNLSTMKLPLETFYAQARDVDVLIYNSAIEGVLETREQLIETCPMLADFKAVQSGDVWCTSKSLYQKSMELADFIEDMNTIFTQSSPDETKLHFLKRIV